LCRHSWPNIRHGYALFARGGSVRFGSVRFGGSVVQVRAVQSIGGVTDGRFDDSGDPNAGCLAFTWLTDGARLGQGQMSGGFRVEQGGAGWCRVVQRVVLTPQGAVCRV